MFLLEKRSEASSKSAVYGSSAFTSGYETVFSHRMVRLQRFVDILYEFATMELTIFRKCFVKGYVLSGLAILKALRGLFSNRQLEDPTYLGRRQRRPLPSNPV